MLERDSFRYLLAIWAAVAVARILLAPTDSPLSYVLLGLLWCLSAVLLVFAMSGLRTAKSPERIIEASCLGLMMSSLLFQAIGGGSNTIGITTAIFFASLVLLGIVYIRRRRRMSSP